MEDINLLPKNLRPKEERKIKAPPEKTVDFIYPQKTNAQLPEKQKSQAHQAHQPPQTPQAPISAKDKDAALTHRHGTGSIKDKIQSALLIFKKFKILDLKKILHHQKKKEALEPKPAGLSVDLLKEELALQRTPKPELIKLFIIAAIIALFFIGALFYYKSRHKQIQENINVLGIEIQNLDAELADLRAKQESLRDSDRLIEAVYVLLKNRINWLAFLKEIENKTLKTVYYTQLEAKDLNEISITARAQSMEDCLKQINIFKTSSDFAKDVVLGKMNIKEDKTNEESKEKSQEAEPVSVSMIEFDFEFAVNPEWITKNNY